MDTISVLVVDDSALMRNLVSRIVDEAPDMTVAGKAMNGEFALQKIPILKPDIIILDLEMPKMNGLEFLEARRKQGIDIPVIILSSIARKGAKVTMDALSMGASDFVTKPSGSISTDIHVVANHLQALIRAYGGKYARSNGKKIAEEIPPLDLSTDSATDSRAHQKTSEEENRETGPVRTKQRPDIPKETQLHLPDTAEQPRGLVRRQPGPVPKRIDAIVIGISTGGPNALRKMLAAIDRDLKQPILIVQHMPAGFTFEFAKSLDRICPLTVSEAKDGDLIEQGHVYIAPGNSHIEIQSSSHSLGSIKLSSAPAENGHRPSADVLFRTAAELYGNRCLAVIMTGMGRDGAREIGSLYEKGAICIGQDPASCVVYGMPKVAWDAGYLQQQIPLSQMAERISGIVKDPAAAL
ncbi:protein-glutamate methylesterase/protein-glutamine glutaminase [Spirochaeta dissipatitropha]